MRFRPEAIWFTSTTWGMPRRIETQLNSTDGLYMNGAGQWHTTMAYSDDVIGSTDDFKSEYQSMFGSQPSYDAVASYTVAWTYMKAIQQTFEAEVGVVVDASLLDGDRYSSLRRNLILLRETETLYGPISFDRTLQRNVGRSPAASQMHPATARDGPAAEDGASVLVDVCIAPLDVASGGLIFPSPGSLPCPPGQVAEHDRASCLMCDRCRPCSDALAHAVTDCDARSERLISFAFVSGRQCTAGVAAPPPRAVECEFVPADSTNGRVVLALCWANVCAAALAAVCLFLDRLVLGSFWKSLALPERAAHCLGLAGLVLLSIGGLLFIGRPARAACEGSVSLALLGVAVFIGACTSLMEMQSSRDRMQKSVQIAVAMPAVMLLLIVILLTTSPPDPGTRLSAAHGLLGVPQSRCFWPESANTVVGVLLFYLVCCLALSAYLGFSRISSSLNLVRHKKERLKRLMRMAMLLVAVAITAAVIYAVSDAEDKDGLHMSLSILVFIASLCHYANLLPDIAPTLLRHVTSRSFFLLFDQDQDAERATRIGSYITRVAKVTAVNAKNRGGGFYIGYVAPPTHAL